MSQPIASGSAEVDDVTPEAVEIKKKGPKAGNKIKLPAGYAEIGSDVSLASTPSADQPDESAKRHRKASKVSPSGSPKHPKFAEMVTDAIVTLKERGGSSRQAIQKYITQNFPVDPKVCEVQVKRVLRSRVANGHFIQVKGTGASGSFKINKEHVKKVQQAAKKATKALQQKASKPQQKKASKPPQKNAPKPQQKKESKKPVKKSAKLTTSKKVIKLADKKVKKPMKPAKKPTPKMSAKKPKTKA